MSDSKYVLEQMKNYTDILRELHKLGVVRTSNQPVGDYAEWLVTQKLSLILSKNSEKSFDAQDKEGNQYQIKARLQRPIPKHTLSRRLGIIRNYNENDIENKFLIVVFFDKNFMVKEAYKIPYKELKILGKLDKHQNGIIVTISEKRYKELVEKERIEDITELLRDN